NLEYPSETAGRKKNRLRPEDVNLAGLQFKSHDSRNLGSVEDDVDCLKLVVELYVVLDALLVEGLQNHMASSVGRVTAPSNRSLAEVSCVPAEASLSNLSVLGPAEWQAHVL